LLRDDHVGVDIGDLERCCDTRERGEFFHCKFLPSFWLLYQSQKGLANAEIIHDRDRIAVLWNNNAALWFPKGPDDPDICIIRVTVETAEYWDRPSARWIYVYQYLKAQLTGEPPEQFGENKAVQF
jgi:hypothetical protein